MLLIFYGATLSWTMSMSFQGAAGAGLALSLAAIDEVLRGAATDIFGSIAAEVTAGQQGPEYEWTRLRLQAYSPDRGCKRQKIA